MARSRKRIGRLLHGSASSHRALVLRLRSDPSETVFGIAVAVGRKWALFQQLMDGGGFDGHIAVRVRDLVEVTESRGFQDRAAQLDPAWPPSFPGSPDLDTTRGALRAMSASGGLVGVESMFRKHALWIGVVDEVARHRLWLYEVSPQAQWHDAPRGYRLRRLTAIHTGGQYLRGLASVTPPGPPGPGARAR